jgi:hypothetical protein
VRADGIDTIAVGCTSGTLAWWEANGIAKAKENGISEAYASLYELHIRHIAAVMELYRINGWVKPIPEPSGQQLQHQLQWRCHSDGLGSRPHPPPERFRPHRRRRARRRTERPAGSETETRHRFKILHNVATGEFALAPVKESGPNVKSMSAKKPRFTCELLISTMNLKPGDELLATENEPGIFVLTKIADDAPTVTEAPPDQTHHAAVRPPAQGCCCPPPQLSNRKSSPQDPDEQPEPQESHAPPARKPRQFSRS